MGKLTVWQKLLLLVLIPLSFEFILVVSLAALLKYTQEETRHYETSREVLRQFHKADTQMMRYLDGLVMAFDTREDLNIALSKPSTVITETCAAMVATADIDPQLREAVKPFPEVFARTSSLVERSRQILSDPATKRRAPNILRTMWFPVLAEIFDLEKPVLEVESRIKAQAPQELKMLRVYIILMLTVGTIVSACSSAMAAVLFANGIVGRLHKIAEDAHAIALGAELGGTISDGDEIEKLSAAVHEASQVLAETRKKELAVLDVATDVMCSLDTRFRFTAVGPAVLKAWGYEADDLMGESISVMLPKYGQQIFRDFLAALPRTGMSKDVETEIICKNGTNKDILWKINWSAIHSTFFCVAHDITVRREADRMKQRFISMASHDLRTPLSSISAKLSLLIEGVRGPVPEQSMTVLRRAQTSLSRLTDLINDLLDLEKLEAGKMIMKVGPVSALDLCCEASDSLESLARSFAVNIVKPNNDALVGGDERQLLRVVTNLLSNAIKFSPKGSTVLLSVAKEKDLVKISVHDQGPGVPVADRSMIFEKFKQSKHSTSSIKGTGLGLAICKLIVDAHDGHLGIATNNPAGSIFFMEVPAYQDRTSG